MITHYFGFTTMPFLKDIPPKDMFSWKEFENLNQRLGYFLKEGGIFLLTGLIGSGKTVALKYFAHSTNPNSHHIIYLNCMFDTKKDFYQTILKECGVNPSFFTGDCRSMLKKYILDMHYTKRLTPILIFDEAQNLPGFLIEEIRLLSNFDFDSSSPLLIILAGHKLLQQRMAMHENEALRQRLTLRFHLQGLNLEDTCAYLYTASIVHCRQHQFNFC